MPWQEVSTMALRQEFVMMVQHGTVNISELCRRVRVSCKTGYKWLARFAAEGARITAALRVMLQRFTVRVDSAIRYLFVESPQCVTVPVYSSRGAVYDQAEPPPRNDSF